MTLPSEGPARRISMCSILPDRTLYSARTEEKGEHEERKRVIIAPANSGRRPMYSAVAVTLADNRHRPHRRSPRNEEMKTVLHASVRQQHRQCTTAEAYLPTYQSASLAGTEPIICANCRTSLADLSGEAVTSLKRNSSLSVQNTWRTAWPRHRPDGSCSSSATSRR